MVSALTIIMGLALGYAFSAYRVLHEFLTDCFSFLDVLSRVGIICILVLAVILFQSFAKKNRIKCLGSFISALAIGILLGCTVYNGYAMDFVIMTTITVSAVSAIALMAVLPD